MFVVNDPGTMGELNLTVAEALCPSKADTGNQKIKAQFGQQQTHNKQVIVQPFGIICSHATFFWCRSSVKYPCKSIVQLLVRYLILIIMQAHGKKYIFGARCSET